MERSQPWMWCSFGKLGWVLQLNSGRDWVCLGRWGDKWTTPSIQDQGGVSQIEHKAWYRNRGYARMLDCLLNNHWSGTMNVHIGSYHCGTSRDGLWIGISHHFWSEGDTRGFTPPSWKRNKVNFQTRDGNAEFAPTINVKIFPRWHTSITLCALWSKTTFENKLKPTQSRLFLRYLSGSKRKNVSG